MKKALITGASGGNCQTSFRSVVPINSGGKKRTETEISSGATWKGLASDSCIGSYLKRGYQKISRHLSENS